MNKVLLLIVISVFMVVAVLVFNLGSGSDDPQPVSVSTTSPAPAVTTLPTDAEKDTYVNTVQTITAQYSEMEKKMKSFIDKQEKAFSKLPKDEEIDRTVGGKVMQSAEDLRADFQKQLSDLRDSMERKYRNGSVGSSNGKELPNGIGFDKLNTHKVSLSGGKSFNGWSTVTPMGSSSVFPGVGDVSKVGDGLADFYASKTSGATKAKNNSSTVVEPRSSTRSKKAKVDPKSEIKPVYTIPRNSTLFDNDTMTALLGIIPIEGSILDPIRFKLITGPTNMATNGLYIPGVRNIVWSGIAIGNREMSCVRGELHSVTFTFEDGTIRTVSTGKSSADTKSSTKQILGYISDRQGSPCLHGKLITNATDYLKDRMIASGIAATADAYAITQETNVIDESGSTQSFFTGDTSKYVAGKAISGSLLELSQYMRDRARNAVDLVYLEAGQQVVLHVEDQIDIDYDPNGRKLEYENPLSALSTTGYGLD